MFLRTHAAILVLLVLLVLMPASGARAQSFLQSLFGFGGPPPRNQPPPLSYRQPQSANPDFLPEFLYEFDDGAPRAPATYRTLCVRLCDGYYFPISFAAPARGLSVDADRCSASCGAEARLFFYENPGGDIGSARDFSGLQYEVLPNAFRYRKTMVEGCQCRPEPWSEAERQRHQGYAALVRRPAPSPVSRTQVPLESGERPLAMLRRGAPVEESTPAGVEPEPIQQDALQQPAPAAEQAPPPRRKSRRALQADADFLRATKSILFGAPPPLPRR